MFNIYIARLGDLKEEKIDESFPPDFLKIEETDILFPHPVLVKGKVYLANNELIMQLTVTTCAKMKCSICDEFTSVDIKMENTYITIDATEIKNAIYDYSKVLREELLLGIPIYVECENGFCPKREDISQYLKKEVKTKKEENYFPFSELNIK